MKSNDIFEDHYIVLFYISFLSWSWAQDEDQNQIFIILWFSKQFAFSIRVVFSSAKLTDVLHNNRLELNSAETIAFQNCWL